MSHPPVIRTFLHSKMDNFHGSLWSAAHERDPGAAIEITMRLLIYFASK